MVTFKVRNLDELVDAICGGNNNPHDLDFVTIEIRLWDGRIVTGLRYHDVEIPNISADEDYLPRVSVKLFVLRMLSTGESFITKTGVDLSNTIIWQIDLAVL
jgi:hypothetical protein